jgi:hypothetical protein
VKTLAPLLTAGAAFAFTTLAGLALGIVIARATNQPMWVFGCFMAGMGIGGYSAVRLLVRSI